MATEVIKTIKASGGDYTTVTAWVAGRLAVNANFVTADVVEIAECDAFECADGTPTLDGATTDETHYWELRPASGAHHGGKWGGFRIVGAGWDHKLRLYDAYTRVHGICVQDSTNSDNNLSAIVYGYSFSNLRIYDCIVRKSAGTGTGRHGIKWLYWNNPPPHYIYNNIVYGFPSSFGITAYGEGAAAQVYIENNTVVNCLTGIDCATMANKATIKNNIISGCTTAMAGTASAGSGYNATDLASLGYTVTGGATGDHTEHTFTFNDPDNDDYTLDSADVGAKDLGTNSVNCGHTTDIIGTTRSGSWDIGAFEIVAAGIKIPVAMHHYQQAGGL